MTTSAPHLSPNPTVEPRTLWDIDTSHARAGFKVRHLMVAHVRGELGPVTGSVWIDEKNPDRSRVEVQIDVRGINTREPARDEHLRSADFFDAERHPQVKFVSTSVKPGRDGKLELTGELTIKETTRSITLEVDPITPAITDPWGKTRRGATASGKLNRKDFGLQWNMALEAGGFVVGDEVQIEIEVELTERQ